MSPAEPRLRVVSFNIRRASDRHGSHLPQLIAEVLRRLEPDLVALQEVDSRLQALDGRDQLAFLAAETGAVAVAGPNIHHASGRFYGNAVLARLPVLEVRRVDLSVERAEPRGALDLDLRAPGGVTVRLVAAHLGLCGRERRRQVGRLLAQLGRHRRGLTVVAGDFNEWRPLNRTVRRLDRRLGPSPRRRTFPALAPLLALDRVWVDPSGALEALEVVRGPRVERVSDHLPLCASIRLPGS